MRHEATQAVHFLAVLFMANPLRVYIGWDRRESEAYEVAKFSLEPRFGSRCEWSG
jgi:hypothetical protein